MAGQSELVKQCNDGTWLIWCTGCQTYHFFDARWRFNNNVHAPTFAPSLKVTWDFGPDHEPRCCHSFVRDGQWQYLDDCTHTLAGQTVPVEVPPGGW